MVRTLQWSQLFPDTVRIVFNCYGRDRISAIPAWLLPNSMGRWLSWTCRGSGAQHPWQTYVHAIIHATFFLPLSGTILMSSVTIPQIKQASSLATVATATFLFSMAHKSYSTGCEAARWLCQHRLWFLPNYKFVAFEGLCTYNRLFLYRFRAHFQLRECADDCMFWKSTIFIRKKFIFELMAADIQKVPFGILIQM